MGNLIKETPYSEITATLEVLDKLGVERRHLQRIRVLPELAERVVKAMQSELLRCKHCGSTRLEPDHGGIGGSFNYGLGRYIDFCDAIDERGAPYLCRDCADREDLKRKGIVRLFVDYTRPLAEMVKDGQFDAFQTNIITKKSPLITRRPNAEVEMKVFHFNRVIGSDEVIREMDKEGYHPAELPEGLAYAKANQDEQRKHPFVTVILGSVWQLQDNDRHVLCIQGAHGGRALILGRYDNRWCSYCGFLGVRK